MTLKCKKCKTSVNDENIITCGNVNCANSSGCCEKCIIDNDNMIEEENIKLEININRKIVCGKTYYHLCKLCKKKNKDDNI